MKKNKERGLFISTFAISFGIVFVFLGASLICIKNYVKIDVVGWFWGCVGISLAISAAVPALTLRSAKQIGETRFSFWLGKNYPKFWFLRLHRQKKNLFGLRKWYMIFYHYSGRFLGCH